MIICHTYLLITLSAANVLLTCQTRRQPGSVNRTGTWTTHTYQLNSTMMLAWVFVFLASYTHAAKLNGACLQQAYNNELENLCKIFNALRTSSMMRN